VILVVISGAVVTEPFEKEDKQGDWSNSLRKVRGFEGFPDYAIIPSASSSL